MNTVSRKLHNPFSSVFTVVLFFFFLFYHENKLLEFGQLLYLLIKYLKLFTLRVYETNKKSIGHCIFEHQKIAFLALVHYVIQERFSLNTIAQRKTKSNKESNCI